MERLIKILENHAIDYKVINGRVIGLEYLINEGGKIEQQEVDLTDYTYEELAYWLGY